MPHFNSWPWKLAIVLALVGIKEFVRLLSLAADDQGNAGKPNSQASGETDLWVIELLDSATIAIGLVLFVIQPFLIQPFYIPSGSMENTLHVKDRVLVSKLVYRLRDPHFEDVVVFKAPPAALRMAPPSESIPGEETDYIKRCIGTPGDVVYAENRKYYRNGKLLDEPYVFWSSMNDSPSYAYDMKIVNGVVYSREYQAPGIRNLWQTQGIHVSEAEQARISAAPPGPVPAGMFLMLGDHRNNSSDGHEWGFVPRASVVGKAVCVFWPPTRLGLLDHMSLHPRATDAPRLPDATETMP